MWHGFSWKFHVISYDKSTSVWFKSTPNSMTIPCHLSRFYLFSMLEHDMDFNQVQVMGFPLYLLRKWWDFPCGFGLIFEPNQTAVKKTWEHIKCHIFYRVIKKLDVSTVLSTEWVEYLSNKLFKHVLWIIFWLEWKLWEPQGRFAYKNSL